MRYARCGSFFILYNSGSRSLLHFLNNTTVLLRLLPWFLALLPRLTPSPRPGATDLMSLITPAVG